MVVDRASAILNPLVQYPNPPQEDIIEEEYGSKEEAVEEDIPNDDMTLDQFQRETKLDVLTRRDHSQRETWPKKGRYTEDAI